MPSTELLSLSAQNQAPLRDGGTAGLRLAAPGTPNSPPASGCAPPHMLCGFPGSAGPGGLQVCVQGTWFSSRLHRFYPCVEPHSVNASVRKGKWWWSRGEKSDRKCTTELTRAGLLVYSLRTRTEGVNRQLLLLHNCECLRVKIVIYLHQM